MKTKLLFIAITALFALGFFLWYEVEYWTPRIILKYAMTRK